MDIMRRDRNMGVMADSRICSMDRDRACREGIIRIRGGDRARAKGLWLRVWGRWRVVVAWIFCFRVADLEGEEHIKEWGEDVLVDGEYGLETG
jgi:hypothetical protein